jgi:hypothetical protein
MRNTNNRMSNVCNMHASSTGHVNLIIVVICIPYDKLVKISSNMISSSRIYIQLESTLYDSA